MRTILAVAILAASASAHAAISDPNWTETLTWSTNPLNGFHTGLAWAPDGSDRLFVLGKSGRVSVLQGATTSGGAGTWSEFALITPIFTASECGLIGMAFDPNFVVNQYVYFFVTVSDDEQQIIRYTANGTAGTAKTIIRPGLPTDGNNHDGGGIGFGRDGKLYWSIGDLGSSTGVNADLTSLAAKVGRANRDGSDPGDNPFADGVGPNNEFIWARGFRNPFTMTFEPASGDMWLNVVGTAYEQVFVVNRGDHAGYNVYENNQPANFITPKIVYRTNNSDIRNFTGAATRTGGVATFTTVANHGFRVGGNVTIAGVSNASFNGANQYIESVPTPTTFTVSQAGPDANGTGGTATTLNQGGCLTGGTFYDATAASADYRGNYFYGDCNSARVNRARVQDGEVLTTDHWATGYGSQVDAAVGPDGALYFTGTSNTGVVRRAQFNATAQGLVVANQHLRADEGGAVATTVSLALAPASDVTVTVARSGGDADIGVTTGSTLTFTPTNWNRPQTVRIDAANDLDLADDLATVTVSSAGLASVPIEVTTLDLGAIAPPSRVFANGFE